MISLSTYLYMLTGSGAVLALWVLSRYPRLGPTKFAPALGLVIAAVALGHGTPFAISVLVGLPYGIYVVFFTCVLPTFFLVFLTAAWLLRSLAAMTSGGLPSR